MPLNPDHQPAGVYPATPPADAGRPGEPAEPSGLPYAETLLALERQARQKGTGLAATDLEGLWWLERVWPRGQRRSSALAGSLLRGLGASLRIAVSVGSDPADPAAPTDPAALGSLRLTNSVRLGPVQLRFQGPGWLQGKRPLLLFQFDRLEIRVGDRVLLARSIPAPQPQRQPFFALIARGHGSGWLAARGRSGGLAVWRLDGESGLANPDAP